jgi:hypothetical protein
MAAIKVCPSSAGRPATHQYRLMYHANEHGVAKRTEFAAASLPQAIEFGLSDPSVRVIDIWEDGEFACRLSPDPRRRDARRRGPRRSGAT